jgi:hypothetical protein
MEKPVPPCQVSPEACPRIREFAAARILLHMMLEEKLIAPDDAAARQQVLRKSELAQSVVNRAHACSGAQKDGDGTEHCPQPYTHILGHALGNAETNEILTYQNIRHHRTLTSGFSVKPQEDQTIETLRPAASADE